MDTRQVPEVEERFGRSINQRFRRVSIAVRQHRHRKRVPPDVLLWRPIGDVSKAIFDRTNPAFLDRDAPLMGRPCTDAIGLGVSGSLEIDENFHVFGDYQAADIDFGTDLTILEIGVGYHTNLSPFMDVYANLAYIDIEADALIGSADDSGLSMGIGLRGSISETVELYGGLDYIDFDDSDSETRANAGILLSLTETLSLGLRATLWDDVNVFQINARMYFR